VKEAAILLPYKTGDQHLETQSARFAAMAKQPGLKIVRRQRRDFWCESKRPADSYVDAGWHRFDIVLVAGFDRIVGTSATP